MLQPYNWVIEPTASQNGLLISSITLASSSVQLKKLNIRAVVSILSPDTYLPVVQDPTISYCCLQYYDHPDEELLPEFNSVCKFIDSNIEHGNVLVHCLAGISRSATFVIAYLMRRNKWSRAKAFQKLKQKRPQVRPNQGFMDQLDQWGQELQSLSSSS